MKLQLLDFIKQNKENWKEVLQQPPYSLIVKEDDDYILLKYNQLESDLSNSIVQECRGIILRKSDLKVVCFPFTKFFNYHEPNAANIDWDGARVLDKIDGCFTRFDAVMLADGTKKPISEIVNKKLSCEVLSYNFLTGKVEPKKVVGWKRLKNQDHCTNPLEWVTIHLGDARQTLNGRQSQHNYLTATKNHLIFVQDIDGNIHEKPAGTLTTSDLLLSPVYALNEIEEQIIYGGLLGDASLTYYKQNDTCFPGFRFSHSIKQQEYSRYKKLLLNHFNTRETVNLAANNYGGNYIRQATWADPALLEVKNTCYFEGKKKVTLAWLNKLNWLGFAFWYMDDGYLNKSAKNNCIGLCTEGFSKEEVLLIKSYYESLGYQLYIRSYRGYFGLNFSTKSSESIWKNIRVFIPPFMQYKLPDRHKGFYDETFLSRALSIQRPLKLMPCRIESIEPFLNRKSVNDGACKYDIEVEGNHNYFCGGVLVHNSLMKLWFDKGDWHWSTNGNIDADETEFSMNDLSQVHCPCKTFGELIRTAVNYKDLDFNNLNKNFTYMFELVSPYTKIVIPYSETKLYHLATRDNTTFEELETDIGVEKPKSYNISTVDDCVLAAEKLSSDYEGFVVVDKNYNRIKIKNPKYLMMHRMASNNSLSIKNILEMIKINECSEFLSYFPEYKNAFNIVDQILKKYYFEMSKEYYEFKEQSLFLSRKEIAEKINRNAKWKDYLFGAIYKNETDAEKYLFEMKGDRLLNLVREDYKKMMEKKDADTYFIHNVWTASVGEDNQG